MTTQEVVPESARAPRAVVARQAPHLTDSAWLLLLRRPTRLRRRARNRGRAVGGRMGTRGGEADRSGGSIELLVEVCHAR